MRNEIERLKRENADMREGLVALEGDKASLNDLLRRGNAMRGEYFVQLQQARAEIEALRFQLRSEKIARGKTYVVQSG